MTVRAVPDAVIFYDDTPPLIVDWKVHVFGLQEAWTQLATYAIALMRCKPHSDFPASFVGGRSPTCGSRRPSSSLTRRATTQLSEGDVERADAYIAQSVTLMLLATEGRRKRSSRLTDFPVAASPEICQRCPYRKLCWEEPS